MDNLTIDWFNVKDPHPAALPNIQRAIDHMVVVGATNKFAPISIYAITKALGKQQKQVTQLIRDRPGFVQVMHNGKSRGYYYDIKNFGRVYPAIYGTLRAQHDLLSVEDIEETVKQERAETVQEFNQRMPEMAKQLAKTVEGVKQPEYTEISLPGGGKRTKVIVEFSLVEDVKSATFVAFDQLMDRNRTIEKKEESGLALVNILLTRLLATKENNVQREGPQES